MKKRKRRNAREVRQLRDFFSDIVEREGQISLTDLISKHGSEVNVRNTPSDKNLVKRQLEQLASQRSIQFQREGRDLVARKSEEGSQRINATPPSASGTRASDRNWAEKAMQAPSDLQAIRAFARQLEEFSNTLHDQIATLVRMVEKASQH